MVKKEVVRRDIILIACVLIAAFAALLIINLTKQSGTVAVIYVNNDEYARMPLDVDAEIVIYSDGKATNTLVVQNGKAYMSSAVCPDKICVNTGSISNENEMIVCLPNKVIVVIEKEN